MPSVSRLLPGATLACALLALAVWLGVSQPDATGVQSALAEPARPLALPAPPAASARVFAADAEGRLVVDQRTRLALEAQVAQPPEEQAAARVEPELRLLPPAAAADARDLLRRYIAYAEVVRVRFPRPLAPLSAEQQLAELSALSSLRIAHFGADDARRMFGDEEALSRRLLEQGRDGQARSR